MKVALVGNPNVGKSAVFNRLTGASVIVSNYPGTTVEFTRGTMHLGGQPAEVVDLPGTYSLEPTCKAEEVTAQALEELAPGRGRLILWVQRRSPLALCRLQRKRRASLRCLKMLVLEPHLGQTTLGYLRGRGTRVGMNWRRQAGFLHRKRCSPKTGSRPNLTVGPPQRGQVAFSRTVLMPTSFRTGV